RVGDRRDEDEQKQREPRDREALEGQMRQVVHREPAEPDPQRTDEEAPGDHRREREDAGRDPAVVALERVRDPVEHGEDEQRRARERRVAVLHCEIPERADRREEHGQPTGVDQERRALPDGLRHVGHSPTDASPLGGRRYQPRVSSSSLGSSVCVEMPTIGSPRPAETRARISASWKCVVASTIAFARSSGSPDLKIPEPTKTPSAPSCMQSAASAGVAIPPAVKVTTGRRPFSATQRTSSYGACRFLASQYNFYL